MRVAGDTVRVRVEAGVRMPPGGIVVRSPRERSVRSATVNGKVVRVTDGREVAIRQVPAELTLSY
jgi:hypothetical protein